MQLSLKQAQRDELERAARRHPDAHVRSRALAVRAVFLGLTRREVSQVFPYSPYSIGQWCAAFAKGGVAALAVAEGRGRHSQVNEQEVLACLRRSPGNFGIDQTRWTLRALGLACPSLADMSERGIQKVLNRLGFRYKRGQPWIHSPDPLYTQKKTPSSRPMQRRSKTRNA
jgi:transposase